MKTFLFIVGVLVLLFALIAVPVAFKWYSAPFRGAIDAREQIQASGTFRIQAYESFYNRCASIMGLERNMDSQLVVFNATPDGNAKRISLESLAGMEGERNRAIAQYNVDSHKQWTSAQFKSESLIYEIPEGAYLVYNPDTGTFKKGRSTICVID